MKKKEEPKVAKTAAPKVAKKTAPKAAKTATPKVAKTVAPKVAKKTVVKKTAEKEAKPKKVAVKKEVEVIKEAYGLDLAKMVAQGMFEKKAENIKILDMRGLAGASADFFVISHATSDKQVEAIANSAEDEVHKRTAEWPRHREGYENLEWILLDYFDVVAHVFQEEKREFYAIEELWGDAVDVPFKGK